MTSDNPIKYYQRLAKLGHIQISPGQQFILAKLSAIHTNLLADEEQRRSLIKRLFKGKRKTIKGMYLWGGVGIGKSFLMDCFFQSLPMKAKLRMHYHAFMRYIHDQLKELAGQKNPLELLAKQIAAETRVICLDEFIVNDIADAMILAGLLKALFENQVTLITTSNRVPDDLYLKGLQRQRFLPAISLLKKQTAVVELHGHDYRKSANKTHFQFVENYQPDISGVFQKITDNKSTSMDPITINHRVINVIKRTDTIIWFDFLALCNIPRSGHDYLEIAKQYQTVFISDIPHIKPNQTNLVRNLINLIDVFYDEQIHLLITAADNPENLYIKGKLSFAFARTCSRLTEMQAKALQTLTRA